MVALHQVTFAIWLGAVSLHVLGHAIVAVATLPLIGPWTNWVGGR